jgi:SAM-dependent methyltransferase
MNLELFPKLLGPAGQAVLADAAALDPTESAFLSCFDQLRKLHPAELAKAALETALLRIKARARFTHADRMYFTREALEQATSEVVARHRAGRFATFGSVADLCCGIGGDALALAGAGLTVEAVDSDPLRVAMADANAAALGVADRVWGRVGDALTVPLPRVNAAFADPTRRADGRRYLDPEDYAPPLSALRARFAPGFPLAVKIAPGVSQADLRSVDAEVEFVSLNGELKECVLWFGAFRTAVRRATVLPAADSLRAETCPGPGPHAPPRAFLYDPDPAVVRAGLVPLLGERMGARPIDPQVQLLTSDRHAPTPFATAFEVEHVSPFHIRLLREYLRARTVGRVTVIKRGSPADADDLLRKLKLTGPHHRTVLLTRVDGWHAMIVCERVGHPPGE